MGHQRWQRLRKCWCRRSERRFRIALPKERGHLFHGGRRRELQGVLAAIEQLAIIDQRNGRFEYGQAPVERGFRQLFRLAAPSALLRQAFDIRGEIAALTMTVPGFRVQQATAHVGIERLSRDPEPLGGFGGGKIVRHQRVSGGDWLINLINIDD